MQTVQTKISLHSLSRSSLFAIPSGPFGQNLCLCGMTSLFEFKEDYSNIFGVRKVRMFKVP